MVIRLSAQPLSCLKQCSCNRHTRFVRRKRAVSDASSLLLKDVLGQGAVFFYRVARSPPAKATFSVIRTALLIISLLAPQREAVVALRLECLDLSSC